MRQTVLRRSGALLLALVMVLALAAVPARAADAGDPTTPPQLTLNDLTLEVGDIEEVTYTLTPNDAKVESVTCNSHGDSSIIKVDVVDGTTVKVTGVGAGTTVIPLLFKLDVKVTEDDGTETIMPLRNCTVTVTDPNSGTNPDPTNPDPTKPDPKPDPGPPTSISISPDSLTVVRAGTAGQLTATLVPEGATGTVIWRSRDEKVATVSTSGQVVGVGEGETEIYATVEGVNGVLLMSNSCKVTVTVAAATGVIVTATASRTIDQVGGHLQLRGSVSPAGASQKLEWKSDDETVATVDGNGRVTAVSAGVATITATVPGTDISDSETVTVSGVRLREDSRNVNLVLGRSQTLSYDTFGAASQVGQTRWKSDDVNIVAVSSGGSANGRSVGSAVITLTYQVGMAVYTDSCQVTVTENTVGVVEGSATAGVPMAVSSLRSQLDQVCKEATASLDNSGNTVLGAGLSYITNLAVSPSEGVLYYNYVSSSDTGAGVGVQEKYYFTGGGPEARSIESVTFVPARHFNGTATITYTGYNTKNEAYNGTIRLTVKGTDDVTYSTTKGSPVNFQASDFNLICTERTGRTLSYVTFTTPTASQGTLYYGYTGSGQYTTAVNSSNQYYRSRNPYLDQVTFVPAENATGTLRLSYRAVDTAGTSYSGTIYVVISGGGTADEDDDLTYTAAPGSRVGFSVFDLNAACRKALENDSLSYLRFTSLPTASQGVLYYNYRSAGNYDSRVNETTRYYLLSSPLISNISFVPASKDVDTVSIPFTGYSVGGSRFDGTLTIRFSEDGSSDAIIYSISAGKTALFEAADFNEKSNDKTGAPLNYIRFDTLPASGEGTLYYNYNTSTHSGTQAASNTVLYRSYLSQVAFVPRSGFTGTVSLQFTGTNISGTTFTGTVEIQVEEKTVEPIRYSGTSLPITLLASDFESRCEEVLDGELSYVQFTSVDTSAGRLYYGYSGYGTGSQVPLSTQYYFNGSPSLSRLTFLPRAEFLGSTTLRYTAASTTGSTASGTVVITVSGGSSSRFRDLSSYRWAASSVDFLYSCGVVQGISDTQYGPGQNILRRDFVVMLCRAFRFTSAGGENFPDVPANRYYSDAIATAKALGIVEGSNGQFMPNATLSRQDAMLMLQRAMSAAGRYVPNGNNVNLGAYSDQGQISPYARGAVGAMVQLGIVTGNAGQLMPGSSITRAEMAVILHRMMTL